MKTFTSSGILLLLDGEGLLGRTRTASILTLFGRGTITEVFALMGTAPAAATWTVAVAESPVKSTDMSMTFVDVVGATVFGRGS